MSICGEILKARKKMDYAERRIWGEILKQVCICGDKMPKVIVLKDVEYVSEEKLNKLVKKMGIEVEKVKAKYRSAKPGKFSTNLEIELKSNN